ncbi:MAG: hypothetical protein HYV26_07640 [Candidatus Hydrogenedentes bacterium]|nr:hypothetical protein [Candidatus Hydrogenedentota bacterium]
MKDTIDLMPREVTQQRNVRSRMATWLLLGGALLVAVVFSAVSMALRAGSVAAAVAPLREQITTLRQAREQVKPLSEQLRTSLDKQALAARLLQEPAWYAFFSDISAAVHSRVWISSIMAEQLLDRRKANRIAWILCCKGSWPREAGNSHGGAVA